MKREQFELALRLAGEVSKDSDFIVFGSQSILGSVARPPKTCLVSMELDLYPRRYPQATGLISTKLGTRSMFSQKNGFFVDCVTPDLVAFPSDWTERLITFRTKRTGGVTGWCVELHDAAASKLSAGREKDLNYVKALLKARLIKPLILKRRIATLPIGSSHRDDLIRLTRQLEHDVKPSRKKQS